MFESGSSCVVLVMAGLYVEAGVPSIAQHGDAAQRCARAALQARSTNSRGLARTGPVCADDFHWRDAQTGSGTSKENLAKGGLLKQPAVKQWLRALFPSPWSCPRTSGTHTRLDRRLKNM